MMSSSATNATSSLRHPWRPFEARSHIQKKSAVPTARKEQRPMTDSTKQPREVVDRVREALVYPEYNEVDRPDGVEPGLVRIRPTSENKTMNHAELDALRESGFVVETIDIDNEEVWVRE